MNNNLQRIKNTLKLNKEVFKSAFLIAKNGGVNPNEEYLGSIQNFDIFLNDELMKANGIQLAVALFNGQILVDKNFLKLTKAGKIFILSHEIGHLKLHNDARPIQEINKERKSYICDQGEVDPRELEADEYAYSILGREKSLIGLYEVKSFLLKYVSENSIPVKEIDLRISAINKLK